MNLQLPVSHPIVDQQGRLTQVWQHSLRESLDRLATDAALLGVGGRAGSAAACGGSGADEGGGASLAAATISWTASASTGAITVGRLASIHAESSTAPGVLRLYHSAAERDADLGRAVGTDDDAAGAGCILEDVFAAGALRIAWCDVVAHADASGLLYWSWSGALGAVLSLEVVVPAADSATAQGPQGTAGPPGLRGDPGASGAGIVWRGAWDAGTAYSPLDAVSRSGGSYIAAAASTGQDPATDTPGIYWGLMVAPAQSGGGTLTAGSITAGPVDALSSSAGEGAGNYTTATEFLVTTALRCTGARFHGRANRAYKLGLWGPNGTLLASVTVAAATTSGTRSASFSAPVTLVPYAKYRISMWCAAGYVFGGGLPLSTPWMAGPACQVTSCSYYTSGDAWPNATTAGERYHVEPVLQE